MKIQKFNERSIPLPKKNNDDKKIIIVHDNVDWEGLYYNGQLLDQGNSIQLEKVLKQLGYNIEYIDILRRLIKICDIEKILFGTHAPFFEIKSAILKLKEANLSKEEYESITSVNAQKAFCL